MNEKILTVTIPSYNTEQFIDKNLPTFLHEGILEELEVLIVNDGSKDNTLKLAKKYEQQYPSTVRVINKENGGHGSVINTGIQEAKGKFFKVVDGDDWVETDNLVKLITFLKNCDADVVITQFKLFMENNGKTKLITYNHIPGESIMDIGDAIANLDKISIHAVLFRTSMMKSKGVCVREKCYYEDNEYVLYSLSCASTVMFLDLPIEYYLTAQKNQSINNANLYKNRKMFQLVMEDCINWKKERCSDVSEGLKKYINNTVCKIIRTQYNIFIRNGLKKDVYDEFREFDTRFKKNYPNEWKDVGHRYGYVKILQNSGKSVFTLLSALMYCYNRVKGIN